MNHKSELQMTHAPPQHYENNLNTSHKLLYRSEIDGLRALAVIPIILFHAGLSTFSGGFVGVDVFFVISGYLISSIIISEIEAGKFSVLKFYERRARRILPALFFLLVVCTAIAWVWLLPNEMRRFSESVVATSLFSSNILFYKTCGYFCSAELKPLLHTWSLAVEEQFYIVFPILLILTWRLGKARLSLMLAAIGTTSLLLAMYYSTRNPDFDFLMLPTRFWELLIGVAATLYLNNSACTIKNTNAKEILGITGFILIIYSIFLFDKTTPHPSLYTLIPTFGTLLIIVFTNNNTLVGRLLGTKAIAGIGLISYSSYLWHQPLFVFARHRSIDEPSKLLYLALGLLALFVGYLSWRFIEKPFRNKSKFNQKQIFGYAFAGTSIFLTFGFLGYITEGFPSRFSEEIIKTHITRTHEIFLNLAGCTLSNDKFNFDFCIKGNSSKTPAYALIGDSHGQAITHELDEAFKKNNISFIPFVKSGCPLNFFMDESVNENTKECVIYQHAIEKEIKSNNNIKTYILFSRRDDPVFNNDIVHDFDKNIKKGFESNIKSINEILAAGKRVILIYPIPIYEKRISDYMSKNLLFHHGKLDMISTDSSIFQKRINYFTDGYDAIEDHENLVRIRADQIFCNSFEKSKCVTQINGTPLYYDDSHLSNDGAKYIVNEIMNALSKTPEPR